MVSEELKHVEEVYQKFQKKVSEEAKPGGVRLRPHPEPTEGGGGRAQGSRARAVVELQLRYGGGDGSTSERSAAAAETAHIRRGEEVDDGGLGPAGPGEEPQQELPVSQASGPVGAGVRGLLRRDRTPDGPVADRGQAEERVVPLDGGGGAGLRADVHELSALQRRGPQAVGAVQAGAQAVRGVLPAAEGGGRAERGEGGVEMSEVSEMRIRIKIKE